MSLRLFTTEIMQTGYGRKSWRGGFSLKDAFIGFKHLGGGIVYKNIY